MIGGMHIYDPELIVDGREAARWMFPRKEDYDQRTPIERGNMMVLWLTRHGVKPVAKERRHWARNRVNVYRLGDVVDALCEHAPWYNVRK